MAPLDRGGRRRTGAGTTAEIARDFDLACARRGVHGQVGVYELWSSANARRWSAGLRAELARRGLSIDPAGTEMQTFGNWTGCHHKYSNFLAAYLGFSRPARIRAEPEFCGNKGLPMKPARLAQTAVLERNVVLAVFERPDGCPMAQFWDGLRPVYEPPHMAEVELDPARISIYALARSWEEKATCHSRNSPTRCSAPRSGRACRHGPSTTRSRSETRGEPPVEPPTSKA